MHQMVIYIYVNIHDCNGKKNLSIFYRKNEQNVSH